MSEILRSEILSKIFFPFLLCFEILSAAMPLHLWEKSVELKKEQVYKAHFKVGNVEKELRFRWTLFKNQALVLHLNYDKFNHQFLLYRDYQRNCYKIALGGAEQSNQAYFAMYFKSFERESAHLNLYIEGSGVAVLDEGLLQGVQS